MPSKINRKKESEFGGKGTELSGVLKSKPRRALAPHELRRLLVTTGTDDPTAKPSDAVFRGDRPRKEP